jgi:transposase InsO family protein
VQAKLPWKPFKSLEENKDLAPLDLIHSDLCELNGLLTRGGKRYFMTFIDDATRFCYIYLLKTKDKALHYFKIYKAKVDNQLERKIKWLHDGHGWEYVSNDFSQFYTEHAIIHVVTPPYSPQSNGVAERENRTLTYLVNAMLECRYALWVAREAILTANFVLNRVMTKNREVKRYEGWNGRKPNVNFLRACGYGCLAKVNLREPKRESLDLKQWIVHSWDMHIIICPIDFSS